MSATLNDQRPSEFDADRIQEIVTGALGGEQKLIAYGSGTSGELRESSIDGRPLIRCTLDRGTWSVERVPPERKSEALQQFEQKRTQQTATEYQKPVRGRLAIWKKHKLPGG